MNDDQIVIEDVTHGRLPKPAPADPRFDLQDFLLAAGIAFAEAAALVTWWPAALIIAAAFCLGFTLLIEIEKRRERAKKH
jgi:hypothetical protein